MYSNWVCLYAENRILLQIHVSKSGRDLARLATPLFHLMHMWDDRLNSQELSRGSNQLNALNL